MSWHWDQRKGTRRRYRSGAQRTARRLHKIGLGGLASVGALVVGGAIVLVLWDTTIGIVLLVLAAVSWWGLAMARVFRDLRGAGSSPLPDYTVTPRQAARLESAEGFASELGFGGGGDSGGGGFGGGGGGGGGDGGGGGGGG